MASALNPRMGPEPLDPTPPAPLVRPAGWVESPQQVVQSTDRGSPLNTVGFTQDQIRTGVREARAQGFSDADIARGAGRYGVSVDAFTEAIRGMDDTYKAVPNDWRMAVGQGYEDMRRPSVRVAPGGALSSISAPAQGPKTYQPDDRALVSNQLSRLLEQDSPWMQRARLRATQAMNSRGLMNSSMAAGAGEAAAIDSALPIAQADAGTFFTAQRDNFNVENQFIRDSNEFGRRGALAMFDADRQDARQTRDFDFRRGEGALDRQFRADQGSLDRQFQLTRDQQNNQRAVERELEQFDRQVVTDYRNAAANIYNNYIARVNEIQAADMDADVKAAQLAQARSLYSSQQAHTNTVFRNHPRWRAEWSQFVLEFPTGGNP